MLRSQLNITIITYKVHSGRCVSLLRLLISLSYLGYGVIVTHKVDNILGDRNTLIYSVRDVEIIPNLSLKRVIIVKSAYFSFKGYSKPGQGGSTECKGEKYRFRFVYQEFFQVYN